MHLSNFIPNRAIGSTGPTTERTNTTTVQDATQLHFNRLLDNVPDTEHPPPLTVLEGSCMLHREHQAQEMAKQYKTANKQLRMKLKQAELVHQHLYTQLLCKLHDRLDIHTVSLREVCLQKANNRKHC